MILRDTAVWNKLTDLEKEAFKLKWKQFMIDNPMFKLLMEMPLEADNQWEFNKFVKKIERLINNDNRQSGSGEEE